MTFLDDSINGSMKNKIGWVFISMILINLGINLIIIGKEVYYCVKQIFIKIKKLYKQYKAKYRSKNKVIGDALFVVTKNTIQKEKN